MAAAPSEEQFAVLQILLKASKKDEVRHLCQECFLSSANGSEKLIEDTCSTLSVASDEAKQLICSLHRLSRYVVHRGLTSPEEILSLFPEGFHQNLKNLLTKIILENLSAWRNEVQASQMPNK
ncbi:UNVERIFIED_CONTAM: COMM domain-containing protein 9 [Gekko kuhli]